VVRKEPAKLKPVVWMGSSRRVLKTFPEDVQAHVGYALYGAQCGEEYASVKAVKGFGGRSVLEIVAPHDGDTYRAVYTVKFAEAIYVLHAFQKKSKSGIATPKLEIDLIRQRLADAERLHAQRRK
jgi:phage-related protein